MLSFIGVAVVLVSLHSIRNSNQDTGREEKEGPPRGAHQWGDPQRFSGSPYKMETKQQHEMTTTVLSVALEFLVSAVCKQKR